MKDHRKERSPLAPDHGAISDALSWARDVSGQCARAVAIGSHRLLVENHTGILELTDERVRLNTACGTMTVSGRDLALCEARRGSLIIKGYITSVELPPEGGGRIE